MPEEQQALVELEHKTDLTPLEAGPHKKEEETKIVPYTETDAGSTQTSQGPDTASYLATLSIFGNRMLLEIMGMRLLQERGNKLTPPYEQVRTKVNSIVSSYDQKMTFPDKYGEMMMKYGELVQACSAFQSSIAEGKTDEDGNREYTEQEQRRLHEVQRTEEIARMESAILKERGSVLEEEPGGLSLRELFIAEGHKELLRMSGNSPEEPERQGASQQKPSQQEPVSPAAGLLLPESASGNPFLLSDGTLDSRVKTLEDRIRAAGETDALKDVLPDVIYWLGKYHDMWDGRKEISTERDRLERAVIRKAEKGAESAALKELIEAIRTSQAQRNLGMDGIPSAEAFQNAVGPGMPQSSRQDICQALDEYHRAEPEGQEKAIEEILAILDGLSEENAAVKQLRRLCQERRKR